MDKKNVKNCKQCEKGMSSTQKWLIVVSIYVMISAIYGTIEIVKNLYSLF
jgi:hypothetical protein